MDQSEEKSSLYDIYDDLADSDDIYKDLASNLGKSHIPNSNSNNPPHQKRISLISIVIAFITFSLLGNLYYQLSINLKTHGISTPYIPLHPYLIENHGESNAQYIQNGLIGIILGILLPIFLNFKPLSIHSPYTTIIRPLVSFLGLLFAIRKIEWISITQIALVWSVLNLAIWAFVDGTLIVLTYATLITIIGIYINGEFIWSHQTVVMLDYLWFGGLLFGKVGISLLCQ